MRRTIFLLAVLLAGSWGDGAAPPTTPPAEPHHLMDAGDPSPLAFLRAGFFLDVIAWQHAPDSAPRAFSRRPSSDRLGTASDSARTCTASALRESGHLDHASRFALLRAGHGSFHTATPPPFRSV